MSRPYVDPVYPHSFEGKLYIGIYGVPPLKLEHCQPRHPIRLSLAWRLLYVKQNDWLNFAVWGPVFTPSPSSPTHGTWSLRHGRGMKVRSLLFATEIADIDDEKRMNLILPQIPLRNEELVGNVTEAWVGDAYVAMMLNRCGVGSVVSMNWGAACKDIWEFMMKMTERLAYQRRLCQVPTNMTREDFHVAAWKSDNWDKEFHSKWKMIAYDQLTNRLVEHDELKHVRRKER